VAKNLNEHEKIFLDIGGHKGESVKSWRSERGDDWHIVTFEPNPINFSSYDEFDNHTLIKAGVWIEDGELTFYDAKGGFENDESATNCFTAVGGMVGKIPGMMAAKLHLWDPKIPEGAMSAYSLPCVNLMTWIKENCNIGQKIACKMDIEGVEYELIPYLLRNKFFSYIDEFFLECHSHRLLSGGIYTPWLDNTCLGQNVHNHALNACSIISHDFGLMGRHNQILTSLIMELGHVPVRWSPSSSSLNGSDIPKLESLYMWDFNDMNNNGYPTRKSIYNMLNILKPEHVEELTHSGWDPDRDNRHGLLVLQWVPDDIMSSFEKFSNMQQDHSDPAQRSMNIISTLGTSGLEHFGVKHKAGLSFNPNNHEKHESYN